MDESIVKRVLETAITIQQIPAPTFAERRRSEYLLGCFTREGLFDVSQDGLGNVYGRLPGIGQARPVIVSAHMDTVFPPNIDLTVRRGIDTIHGPGIGDNSLGVAGLFGLKWALSRGKIELPGDLWLVANVGEEGLGDLCGMKAVVERFGEQVSAYLILEGMSLGQVYNRGLGVKRYRISVHTTGGHSWIDYGKPSAIHELAELVVRIKSLPVAEQPRSTLNAGVIAGGTSVNTIAAEAHIELDLRSEDPLALQSLAAEVEALVQAANRGGEDPVGVRAEIIGQRPAGEIPANHPLVRLGLRCLEEQGIAPYLNIGSTDANIPLARGLPAICIGLTTGGGAHTTGEYIQVRPLAQGLAQLVEVARGAFRLSAS